MAEQLDDESSPNTVTADDRFAFGVLLIQEYASLRDFVQGHLSARLVGQRHFGANTSSKRKRVSE